MTDKEKLLSVLSRRIKKARTDKGLTQPELAKLIDSTDRNISNYETGYSFPSIIVLYKISIALSTSIDYLLGISDDPTISKSVSSLTSKDITLLEQLKAKEELYAYMVKNDSSIYYLNEVWNLMNRWKDSIE